MPAECVLLCARRPRCERPSDRRSSSWLTDSLALFSLPSSRQKPKPDISYSVKDLFSLKGKTAIITGGGSGIGLAVSQAYAEAGANVVMIYNSSPSAIDRAKETAEEYGVKCVAKKCDVGSYADIHKVFDEVTKEFGSYDIMVANSGVQQNNPCLTLKPEEWEAIIRVNFSGVFYCAQKAAQDFKSFGKPGNIIVTASMSGVIVNVRLCRERRESAVADRLRSVTLCLRQVPQMQVRSLFPPSAATLSIQPLNSPLPSAALPSIHTDAAPFALLGLLQLGQGRLHPPRQVARRRVCPA